MEILYERTKDGRERNALTILSIHQYYEITVDSEPTIKFEWNLKTKTWEYSPCRMYPYTSIMLKPTEILVRLPLDDTLKAPHYPYIYNLENPDLAIRIEKMMGKMAHMIAKLQPPKCVGSLQEALAENEMRKNRYSINQSNTLNKRSNNRGIGDKN
jgi:hypothetical protein